MNYRKVIIILAVLIALPFSPKADDSQDLTWGDIYPDSVWTDDGYWVYEDAEDSIGHLSIPTPPDSCAVYYIDTVGWREVSRDSSEYTWHLDGFTVFEPGPQWDNPAERKTQWIITVKSRPIIDTIIVGYFYTDTKLRIKDWRVR